MLRLHPRLLLLLLPLSVLASCGQQTTDSPPNETDLSLSSPAPEATLDGQEDLPDGVVLSAQSGVKLSDATARSRLRAAGIPVTSSQNCSDRNNSHCTSLEQINSGTISGVIAFKKASACPVTVTGGTETGHSTNGTYTHWNGYKVDISQASACVTTYITRHFTKVATRRDGAAQYKDASGNIYANESWLHHWDVTYY